MTPADRRLPVLAAPALLGLAMLCGCVAAQHPAVAPALADVAVPAGQCRVGLDGGPLSGGKAVADRGIGGTGAPAQAMQSADRGIGGTGIIGVITGFASICLGGQEVAYDPALPVVLDGTPGGTADLRAGQFALVEAAGPDAGLVARRIVVRHEVSGPVEAVEAPQDAPRGTRMMRVAGQRVAVAASTLGDTAVPVGAWVAVSGLRDADGVVHATRLDPAPPGTARIAGRLVAEAGRLRIGMAEIRPVRGVALRPGDDVVAAGPYRDGILLADTAGPDLLPASPAAYFSPSVQVVVIESFAGMYDGRLVLGRALQRGAGHAFGHSVVELQRAGGALQAASVRDVGPGPAGFGGAAATPGARRLEPAPMPFRGDGGPGAGRPGRQGDGRQGDGQRMERQRGRNEQDQGAGGPGSGGTGAAPFGGPAGGFFGGPGRGGR